ncbi:hypothetical protein V8E36_001720 [Tilletia maclaganii]
MRPRRQQRPSFYITKPVTITGEVAHLFSRTSAQPSLDLLFAQSMQKHELESLLRSHPPQAQARAPSTITRRPLHPDAEAAVRSATRIDRALPALPPASTTRTASFRLLRLRALRSVPSLTILASSSTRSTSRASVRSVTVARIENDTDHIVPDNQETTSTALEQAHVREDILLSPQEAEMSHEECSAIVTPSPPAGIPFPTFDYSPRLPPPSQQAQQHHQLRVSVHDVLDTDSDNVGPQAPYQCAYYSSSADSYSANLPSQACQMRMEHEDFIEPVLSTPPFTPLSNCFNSFTSGSNYSHSSMESVNALFTTSNSSSWSPHPNSPFRRAARGLSTSAASVMGSVKPSSPLRTQHVPGGSPIKDKLFARVDGFKWRSSTAALPRPSFPSSGVKISTRRASFGSLNALLQFSRTASSAVTRSGQISSSSGSAPSDGCRPALREHGTDSSGASFARGHTTEGTSPNSPSASRLWGVQPDDDPFASHLPFRILPRRKAASNKDHTDEPPCPAKDGGVESPATPPPSCKPRRPYSKYLPRLSMGSIGLPSMSFHSRSTPDEGRLFSSSRGFLPWRTQTSAPALAEFPPEPVLTPVEFHRMLNGASPSWVGEPEIPSQMAGYEGAACRDIDPMATVPLAGSGSEYWSVCADSEAPPSRSKEEVVYEPGLWFANSPIRDADDMISAAATQVKVEAGKTDGANDVPAEDDYAATEEARLRRISTVSRPPRDNSYARSRGNSSTHETTFTAVTSAALQKSKFASTLRSRTSERPQISTLSRSQSRSNPTSPDEDEVFRALGRSFTALPTPIISRAPSTTGPKGMTEEAAAAWSLLQTASPLCSPWHHQQKQQPQTNETHTTTVSHFERDCDPRSAVSAGNTELEPVHASPKSCLPGGDCVQNEPKLSRSLVQIPTFSARAAGTAASTTRTNVVSVFNMATSMFPFMGRGGEEVRTPPVTATPPLRHRIEMDFSSPALDLLEDIENIIATTSEADVVLEVRSGGQSACAASYDAQEHAPAADQIVDSGQVSTTSSDKGQEEIVVTCPTSPAASDGGHEGAARGAISQGSDSLIPDEQASADTAERCSPESVPSSEDTSSSAPQAERAPASVETTVAEASQTPPPVRIRQVSSVPAIVYGPLPNLPSPERTHN